MAPTIRAAHIHERVRRTRHERPQLIKRVPRLLIVVAVAAMAFVDDVGVSNAADGAEAELHLVTREGAGLVGEDVLNLAELLDKRRCTTECGRVRLGVVHVKVGVDQLGLLEFHDFHGDDERDGDQVIVEYDEGKDIWAVLSVL